MEGMLWLQARPSRDEWRYSSGWNFRYVQTVDRKWAEKGESAVQGIFRVMVHAIDGAAKQAPVHGMLHT
jgi:hypothetical protein